MRKNSSGPSGRTDREVRHWPGILISTGITVNAELLAANEAAITADNAAQLAAERVMWEAVAVEAFREGEKERARNKRRVAKERARYERAGMTSAANPWDYEAGARVRAAREREAHRQPPPHQQRAPRAPPLPHASIGAAGAWGTGENEPRWSKETRA